MTPRQVQIQNRSRPLRQPLSAVVCDSFLCRLRGLTFHSRLAPERGLLLVQGRASRAEAAIHMLAVFTDLAVIWLDAELTVVDAMRAKAWGLAYVPKSPAKYTLEIHPTRLADFEIGDKVVFVHD
jgi:uncharacterized membrane protein (UPF0127 family)